MVEPLVFRQDTNPDTGDVTIRVDVERWPRHIEIGATALTQFDASFCCRDGNLVTFTVANGQATYELGDFSPYSMAYPATLVSSRLSE